VVPEIEAEPEFTRCQKSMNTQFADENPALCGAFFMPDNFSQAIGAS
jgi:hypothetical protein